MFAMEYRAKMQNFQQQATDYLVMNFCTIVEAEQFGFFLKNRALYLLVPIHDDDDDDIRKL